MSVDVESSDTFEALPDFVFSLADGTTAQGTAQSTFLLAPESDLRQWNVPSESTLFSDGFVLRARNISTGKSANPIMRLPIVPRSAEAPPDIGSHGPSSESYSRGRYLETVSLQLQTADILRFLQFQVVEVQKVFVEQSCCRECTKPDGCSFDTPHSGPTW